MTIPQRTYRGYADPALAGHRARFVIHPEHHVPTARLAPGHVARAVAVTSALVLARAVGLVAIVISWVWLAVQLYPGGQIHPANLNAALIALVAASTGLIGLDHLRRWVVDRLPTVPADPTGPFAVDVEHEVSADYRELITSLRDRAQRGLGSQICDQHTCRAVRWLMWDLAAGARAHRRLTLDTVARPTLTAPTDPRPDVLTDLAARIDLIAAVLDTGLQGESPCICRSAAADSDLADLVKLTARATALTARRTASEVTW